MKIEIMVTRLEMGKVLTNPVSDVILILVYLFDFRSMVFESQQKSKKTILLQQTNWRVDI